MVWKLDRLARSLKHLIELVGDFEARGVGLKSVQENIDTTTASGKLFLHIFGALAEFERELIRERTLAGLKAAAERGRKGERPRLMDVSKSSKQRHCTAPRYPLLRSVRPWGCPRGRFIEGWGRETEYIVGNSHFASLLAFDILSVR